MCMYIVCGSQPVETKSEREYVETILDIFPSHWRILVPSSEGSNTGTPINVPQSLPTTRIDVAPQTPRTKSTKRRVCWINQKSGSPRFAPGISYAMF